jgi:hypothetical protein
LWGSNKPKRGYYRRHEFRLLGKQKQADAPVDAPVGLKLAQ